MKPHAIKTVYIVHHSHTDIGYTDLQERVVQGQVNYIQIGRASCRERV